VGRLTYETKSLIVAFATATSARTAQIGWRMSRMACGRLPSTICPVNESQIRESEQRSASLWSAQYCGNDSDGGQIVSDDRTRAVDWVQVLCPVSSCELLVRRNHV